MRRQALALLPALVVAAALAGCGSDGTRVGQGFESPTTGAGTRQATAFDPRDETIACVRRKGITAVKDERYRDRVNILPVTSGAYIIFTGTLQDAQSRALNNTEDAAGAQAIGPALFTVGDLGDDELQKIEDCLDARGVRY